MFERLLQLPLLQGLTVQDIANVMAHVRLNFINYHAGDEIVVQGSACRNLIYIIQGEVTSTLQDSQGHFVLYETLPDTKVLEPYNMFGMYQKFSRTYTFATEGSALFIEKSVMLRRLLANDIVKINMLNITSNRYQQTVRLLCEQKEDNVAAKIVKFLLSHSTVPKGKKELHIKMTGLAQMIHETRLNVSIALNDMQEKGFVMLQRGNILVEDLQKLNRFYQ